MAQDADPKTHISRRTNEAIFVRDANLVEDLIGKLSFTEMMYFQNMGRRPTREQTVLLDAVLVTLMEHGLTPSAITARLIYMSAPEALQSAVAAGLLGVGSTFVGTMENCGLVLEEILAAPEGVKDRARHVAVRYRTAKSALPGFGNHLHRPDDPRSPRLLALAEEQGVPGNHIRALRALGKAVDEVYGRHITINVTGAAAAVLAEIGIPREIMRGVAVVSRAAGLVGHIHEEQSEPSGRRIWDVVEHTIAYESRKDGR